MGKADITVVISIQNNRMPDDTYSKVCETVEGCMFVGHATIEPQNSQAIFEGTTDKPLSQVTAWLYGNVTTAQRIRKLTYRANEPIPAPGGTPPDFPTAHIYHNDEDEE